jgi:hypothetical protein
MSKRIMEKTQPVVAKMVASGIGKISEVWKGLRETGKACEKPINFLIQLRGKCAVRALPPDFRN